jgi:hypothetical protein
MYEFNSKEVAHVQVSKKRIVLPWIICAGIGFASGFGAFVINKEKIEAQSYEQLVVMVNEKENELVSPMAIYEYMKEIGIKYPEIVWSQVALETRFSSQICKENHNYFGMKKANCRPNVQNGENLGHASYRNWKMSVLDYALWQSSTGVWKIANESAYYNYLDQWYAEDQSYAIKVKEIRDNFEYYLNYYEENYKKKKIF